MAIHDWTEMTREERREVWEPLWHKGLTASQIAAHFKNCTRNSVIGAIHRSKMKRAKVPRANFSVPKKPKVKELRVNPKPISAVPEVAPEVENSPHLAWLLENNRDPLPGRIAVSMIDLPNRETVCRFPVVGGYCGADLDPDDPAKSKCCPGHEPFYYAREARARMQAKREKEKAGV